MGHRSKARRILKWVSTAACAIVLFAWLLSAYRVIFVDGPALVSLGGGELSVMWWARAPHTDLTCGARCLAQPMFIPRRALGTLTYNPELLILDVPVWSASVLLALPTALLWYLDRRRDRPGFCPDCGYNLTGNITGRCPECGTPTPASSG